MPCLLDWKVEVYTNFMKRSGIVPSSIPAVSRKLGNGFDDNEFKGFSPSSKRQAASAALQMAMDAVDLNIVGDSKILDVGSAPTSMGDLVQSDNPPVWLEASSMSVWEGNPRHVIDPMKLAQLGDSIENHGQSEPIDVVEDPLNPGKYLILGGQRRWLAVTQRNLQEGKLLARVRVGMPSAETMFAAAVETQINTDPLQDLDFAITLARAKDSIGVRALSKVIDKSPGEISKLRNIGDLPTNLMLFMKEHAKKFTSLFAYEVFQVNEKMGEVQALDFAKVIVTRGLSHKAALTVKENLFGDRQPLRRSSWSTIRLTAGSMRLKEDTGELAVKLKGLSPENMLVIQEAVKKATSKELKTICCDEFHRTGGVAF